MSRIEELEKQAKAILEEIEKLKKEEKEESKVWKPKEDELFYVITGYTDVDSAHFHEKNSYHQGYLKIGNCFKTREEAESMVEKAKIYTQLKRLAEEINTEPIDWKNDEQYKYKIMYNSLIKRITYSTNYYTQEIGQIYCTNKNFLEIAKERIGEENLLKLFKE